MTRHREMIALEAERRSRGVSVAAWEAAPRPPATRADCADIARPCPALRCRHHNGAGPWSCSLDVADAGGITLDEVGRALRVTRERARQLEVQALVQLRMRVNPNARNAG